MDKYICTQITNISINITFKSLKQIFSKFVGQFDLQGQGHKFLYSPRPLDDQHTAQV